LLYAGENKTEIPKENFIKPCEALINSYDEKIISFLMTRFDLVTKNYAKSMKNMNFFLKNEICNKGDSVTMACAGMGKNPRVQEVVINASPSEPKKSTCGR